MIVDVVLIRFLHRVMRTLIILIVISTGGVAHSKTHIAVHSHCCTRDVRPPTSLRDNVLYYLKASSESVLGKEHKMCSYILATSKVLDTRARELQKGLSVVNKETYVRGLEVMNIMATRDEVMRRRTHTRTHARL